MKIEDISVKYLEGKGFIFKDRELVSCTVLKNIVRLSGEATTSFVKLHNGTIVEIEDCKGFYRSENDFKSGEERYGRLSVRDVINFVSYVEKDCDDFVPYYWEFNGEPVKVYPEFSAVSVYSDSEGSLVWTDSKTDCDMPHKDDMYRTRDEALSWNDYTVIKEDGTKEERKSKKKMLLLSKEQEAIAGELMAVLRKCKDNGIQILCDCDYCDLYAVNMPKDMVVEYRHDVEEDTEEICEAQPFLYKYAKRIRSGACFLSSECSFFLF